MKPDLYAVLGIKPNARPENIRRAYRKLARRFHPDANPGDLTVADKYHAVGHAYAILSNPETRKRYDETGDDEIPRDMGLSELAGVLIPAFMEVLAATINSPYGADLKTTDMVTSILGKIRNRRDAVTEQLNAMKRTMTKLREVSGRFTVGDGENLFESAIAAEIGKLEPNIKNGTDELDRIGRALTYMAAVKYRVDPRPGSRSATSSVTMGDLAGMLGMVNPPKMIFTNTTGGV